MPYPFMKFPTFGEVREHLEEEYECHYISDDEDAYFWRRISNGKIAYCEVIADDKDYLLTETVRHICNRLRINPEEFGLTLG